LERPSEWEEVQLQEDEEDVDAAESERREINDIYVLWMLLIAQNQQCIQTIFVCTR
jgi:hypothetical protein